MAERSSPGRGAKFSLALQSMMTVLDVAAGLGLPDCLVGETYYGEPVPTDVEIGPDDLVVFSSRVIPGNEKNVFRVVNNLARLGASRVVPISQIPWPRPWWHHDGSGPLLDLVRWTDLEGVS